MKRTKEHWDPQWGHWKPVKLTCGQRLQIYRALKAGMPTAEFARTIPVPQLESIFREFTPGEPHAQPDPRPAGIRGNKWYCENGCGVVMHEKQDGQVFLAADRTQGQRYACQACVAAIEQEKKAKRAPTC